MTDFYGIKENYLTRNPDPRDWRYHPNYCIMHLHAELIKGKVCADLGCNHGACSILLRDFHAASVHGFDINAEAIEVARASAEPYDNMAFVQANLTDIPAHDGSYDYIQSFHVLEHIFPDDAEAVASEIYRVLKLGGHFLISIPYEHNYPDPCHVAFYTEDSLNRLFNAHGLETVSCMRDDRWVEDGLLTAVYRKSD